MWTSPEQYGQPSGACSVRGALGGAEWLMVAICKREGAMEEKWRVPSNVVCVDRWAACGSLNIVAQPTRSSPCKSMSHVVT